MDDARTIRMIERGHDVSAHHLSAEQVAAFVDRSVPAPDAARLSAHLAGCDECRAEIAEVRRLLPRRGAAWRIWWTAPAAAAVVASILLLRTDEAERAGRRWRSGDTTSVALLAPAHGERVVAPHLTWRPVAALASYRVTVTDSSGATLWTAVVSDTVASPEALPTGATGLLWYVEALWPDGRTAVSAVRSFVLVR